MTFGKILLVAAFMACAFIAICSISAGPAVEISIEQSDTLLFSITTSGINAILALELYSKTDLDLVWRVSFSDFREGKLRLGELPPQSRQSFPKGTQLPRNPRVSEELAIVVVYQYDEWFAACSGTAYFSFSVPQEHKKTMAKAISHFSR